MKKTKQQRKAPPSKKLTPKQRAARAKANVSEPNATPAVPPPPPPPRGKVDPDHPIFLDERMTVYIHHRAGRGADYFLTLDGGQVKVVRVGAEDTRRKRWRPYDGPRDRASAAEVYAKSFLPKTAEAARAICEMQGKTATAPLSGRVIEDESTTQGDEAMATKKAKSKKSGAATSTKKSATTKKPTTAAAKAETTVVPGTRMKGLPAFTLETKVEWLVKENPRREGSETHENWKKYFGAKTVGELFKRGGFPGQLRWDLKHGYLKLVK